jgi:HEAT repeat protein
VRHPPYTVPMNQKEIDELFAQASSGDYEDDTSWEAVSALRRAGTREIFDRAAEWCNSATPLLRARGADVLAQLGQTTEHPNNIFPEQSYLVVSTLLQREKEPLPLNAAIAAMGHIGNPQAVPLLVKYIRDPSPKIRFTLAFALGCFPNDPGAVEALLVLMEDSDADVRDWATFGLGVLGNADSVEIRDALLRRVGDSDENAREEAMIGLSKRKDQRVLEPLIAILEQPDVPSRAIEAADLMLDTTDAEKEWSGRQYAAALRQKFPLQA